MPAYFNVADVGRIVTGKVQHTHFVCEHMSAGSITCSALRIDGQPSQINVAGTMQIVAGTVTASFGIYDSVTCNRITVASQTSLSALSVTGPIIGSSGTFASLNLSTLTSPVVNAQSVMSGTLTSQLMQSNAMTSTNLTVTSNASFASLSSQLTNSLIGRFATVTGTVAQITGAVSAGTLQGTSGSFLSISANTLTTTSLTLNGSASVSGLVNAQSINANTFNCASMSGIAGSFTNSLSTASLSSTVAVLGTGSLTNLNVSGNGSINGILNTVSLTTNYLQTGSMAATILSVSNTLNAGSISCNVSNVSTLSVGLMSSNNINIFSSNVVNFGSDQAKAVNAGQIGYQLTTRGALDVYGAGTVLGSRNIQLWDNVGLVGTLTTANISLSGKITSPSFTPSWTSVGTFLNNWSAYVGQTPPGYWKDPFGIVHLRGLLRNTAASSGVCFVLPTGYLPVNYAYFACSDSNADTNSITVCISSTTSGTVSAGSVTIATSTVTVSLDGVTFATN